MCEKCERFKKYVYSLALKNPACDPGAMRCIAAFPQRLFRCCQCLNDFLIGWDTANDRWFDAICPECHTQDADEIDSELYPGADYRPPDPWAQINAGTSLWDAFVDPWPWTRTNA